ncbi:hypothetical protein L873DRAFT_1355244 [Choiromyces venosus 120613-1]|uniref:Uncharacterized protein n=1 Tax=Choiromyces venosus 120613-1 TaxID=1336337 RepID=A0A3N4K1H5_9PEZI|nr:hypothetical protein L873DRAFT_1355244 [Choiromyces venosus 120613-1]
MHPKPVYSHDEGECKFSKVLQSTVALAWRRSLQERTCFFFLFLFFCLHNGSLVYSNLHHIAQTINNHNPECIAVCIYILALRRFALAYHLNFLILFFSFLII